MRGRHRHHGPPRNPILEYLRARLRRRLFASFTVAIAVTMLFVWIVSAGRPGFFAFAAGAIVLWIASGVIAFRVTRPLAQLVRVTQAIGEGRLDARMRLGRFGGGELQIISDAVNDMAARIERMLAAERELLAAVSHELRTPLSHLRVMVDLVRERGPDAAFVTEVEREVVAIDAMVGQLLARSRVEFGSIDRRPMDAVELALRALERAGLDPTVLHADAERIAVSGDAGLVLQALANLLRNADEHGGGAIALTVRRGDGVIAFEVEDAGPGFEADEMETAFESFRRGERPGRRGSLGLGLALVRRIAEAHGGKAWAINLGPGARVGFSIAT